jgi:phospholipase C
VLRFIEENWHTGRVGDQSFDEIAGSLKNMFDFEHGDPTNILLLDACTGEPNRKNASEK